MSFWQGLIDYIFPVKCAACKTLIRRGEGLLCSTCQDAYREATGKICPLCVKPMVECDCPNRYMERNNLHTLVKLYRYHAGDNTLAENQLIYRLKRATDITVMQFLAAEMIPAIQRHLTEGRFYVLVGVPRSRRAIRKYGEDHIEMLCRELSRRMEIPYVHAVCHVGHGKAQKTKRRAERISSAMQSYMPMKGVDLKGKTVILVDDVATSGASLVACAKVLRRIGAKTIICAVAGVAFRYHDLITDSAYYAERRKKYGI